MKHLYTTLIFLLLAAFVQAQIINIPDARLKEMLTDEIVANYDGSSGFSYTVDTNNDGEIQISEAEAVIGLSVSNTSTNDTKISNLEGLQYFINLRYLNISDNEVTTIDTTPFTAMENLIVSNNLLTSLDISSNANLTQLTSSFNQIASLTVNTAIEYLYTSVNQIASLDLSNCINLLELGCAGNQLSTLDISNNVNLVRLLCGENQLTSLNVSANIQLTEIVCSTNQLTTIDTNNLTNLSLLWCTNNQITSLDVSNNSNLTSFYCSQNLVTNLDISNNTNLTRFIYNNNPQLLYLNEKNGVPTLAGNHNFYNGSACPNLQHVCADTNEVGTLTSYHAAFNNGFLNVNSYCSFVPGGDYFTISGSQKLDLNADGCDASDPIFPNLALNITDGTTSGMIIANNSGNYTINVQAGVHTITPVFENPSYFSVSPTSFTVDFPTDASPYIQDFCITPTGVFNDLEVIVVPLELARPGFDTDYKIIYKNKGNTTLSGDVTLTYADDYMNVLSTTPTATTQATGTISWSFLNLAPFETREVLYSMTLNTPTDASFPLNGGELLSFEANINAAGTDETPEDNNMTLRQEVVNSFDPNDKTCLEGDVVTPDLVGKYVHYLVRFENTGTASAVNVVVRDFVDLAKFDISSLIPLDASHDFYTRVVNDDEVEFVFENIQLPFNDADNDGYVLFKIRTLPTLVVGDTFSNIAGIYFDFNAPIITNNETTTIQDNLSVDEFDFSTIRIYPNPVQNSFKIESPLISTIETIELYSIVGKKLKDFMISEEYNIDDFPNGMYFLKLKTAKAEMTRKIIKQ